VALSPATSRTFSPGGAAGGDLGGSYPDPTVDRLWQFDACAYLSHEATSGTSGGAGTSATYVTRTLNTEVDPDSIVTLAANQFTLAAGAYQIDAAAACYFPAARHKSKVRNITAGSDALIGTGVFDLAGIMTYSFIKGRIVVAGTTVFEVQTRMQTAHDASDFGIAMSYGDVEVYVQVVILREAT
jgi:hypothetical protein